MNGIYMMYWGDPNRPNNRFFLTFNEAALKGPHFTFTISLNRLKRKSFFVIGVAKRWKVFHW